MWRLLRFSVLLFAGCGTSHEESLVRDWIDHNIRVADVEIVEIKEVEAIQDATKFRRFHVTLKYKNVFGVMMIDHRVFILDIERNEFTFTGKNSDYKI